MPVHPINFLLLMCEILEPKTYRYTRKEATAWDCISAVLVNVYSRYPGEETDWQPLPIYKYSRHGRFQAPKVMTLNAELGRGAHSRLLLTPARPGTQFCVHHFLGG